MLSSEALIDIATYIEMADERFCEARVVAAVQDDVDASATRARVQLAGARKRIRQQWYLLGAQVVLIGLWAVGIWWQS